MNRGRINPQQELAGAGSAFPTVAQSLTGVADQTTPAAIYFVLAVPRTPIGVQVFPQPPSDPYYPLLQV